MQIQRFGRTAKGVKIMKVYQLITALADYQLDDDVFFDVRRNYEDRPDDFLDVSDMEYDAGREAVIITVED